MAFSFTVNGNLINYSIEFDETYLPTFRAVTDDGVKLGSLQVHIDEAESEDYDTPAIPERQYIHHIDVDKTYQRKGIGTNLVRAAVAEYPGIMFPTLSPLEEDHRGELNLYTTEQGSILMYSCRRNGIITDQNIADERFQERDPYAEDEAFDGYDSADYPADADGEETQEAAAAPGVGVVPRTSDALIADLDEGVLADDSDDSNESLAQEPVDPPAVNTTATTFASAVEATGPTEGEPTAEATSK